jgi:drug/metabolite transporter (DMT)-like permease
MAIASTSLPSRVDVVPMPSMVPDHAWTRAGIATVRTWLSHAVPRPDRRVQALLALLAASVIWGTSPGATRLVLDHVPPLTLGVARLAVAWIVLRLLLHRSGARPARGLAPALLGLTGMAAFVLCRNVGLHFASATNASLFEAVTPIFVLLLAAITLHEQPSRGRVLGVLASVAGVGLTVLPDAGSLGSSLVGNGFFLVGTACFAAYNVIGRKIAVDGHPLALVTGGVGYGLLFLCLPAALELLAGTALAPDPGDVLLVLYLGAGCSGLAYALSVFGLSRLEAGQVAVFGNLETLVGIGVAVTVLGEAISLGQVIGGALILAGVWLATAQSLPRHPAVLYRLRSVAARGIRPHLLVRVPPRLRA